MTKSKIIFLLFLCSILFFFTLNSFKEKTQPTCSANYIKQWTMNVNAKRSSLRGALPDYENCVARFQNNVAREELLISAYSVLGKYYLDIQNFNMAGYYKKMEARETMR